VQGLGLRLQHPEPLETAEINREQAIGCKASPPVTPVLVCDHSWTHSIVHVNDIWGEAAAL
jgi:hypothetical protein